MLTCVRSCADRVWPTATGRASASDTLAVAQLHPGQHASGGAHQHQQHTQQEMGNAAAPVPAAHAGRSLAVLSRPAHALADASFVGDSWVVGTEVVTTDLLQA